MDARSIRHVVSLLMTWAATLLFSFTAIGYLRDVWEEGFSWIRVTKVGAAGFICVFGWLSIGFGWWTQSEEPRPGHCETCDYDLTGNTSGTCPECGTPIQ